MMWWKEYGWVAKYLATFILGATSALVVLGTLFVSSFQGVGNRSFMLLFSTSPAIDVETEIEIRDAVFDFAQIIKRGAAEKDGEKSLKQFRIGMSFAADLMWPDCEEAVPFEPRYN